MAFKVNAVTLGAGDTTVFECPIGDEGAMHGLVFANQSGGSINLTIKFYDHSAGTTTTVVDAFPIATKSQFTWPKPINLNSGDKVIASGNTIVALQSTFLSQAVISKGFTHQGAYSAAATYAVNDVVSYNGSSYISLIDNNLNSTPPSGNWGLLSSIGTAGKGITSVVLHSGTGAPGTTDTYRITYTDATTFDFDVYNGSDGRSVSSIARTAGTGLAGSTDTYTITYSDATTSSFTVVNGANGRAVSNIARTAGTGAAGTTDTYTITYSDATTSSFTVVNGTDGRSVSSIARTAGTGLAGSTDTYTITYSDATTSNFTVVNGINGVDGTDGVDGRAISNIARTSGTGAAGTTDTYTITYSDATTSSFTVVNGANGTNGRAISSITRTAGTGAAGTTDTYTITYSDASTSTFNVVNGADGIDGEVTGAASSSDNQIALFSGTSGKTIKTATTTGLLKASSGVIGEVVSGTDIKQINGESILGSGNLVVQGGVNYARHTANVTAVNKSGIIADTSGGAFTVTLPLSPSAGDQVFVVDGANWSTNNLTIGRNSSTINGAPADLVLNAQGATIQLIYDGTTWKSFVHESANYAKVNATNNFSAVQNFTANGVTLKGTSSGKTIFSSLNASGTDYTLTFPASSGHVVTAANSSSPITVAQGGTGLQTLTLNNVLLGNGTGALQAVAPSTSGNVLTSNGSTWESLAPSGPSLSANNIFTGANSFQNSSGQTFLASTTTSQDGIVVTGRAGGSTSLRLTLSPATLTGNRSIVFSDDNGTVALDSNTLTLSKKTLDKPAITGSTLTVAGALGYSSGELLWHDGTATQTVGFKNIPQITKVANGAPTTEADLTYAGKHIYHTSTAGTFTIPANASVNYPIGTALTFINGNGAGNFTIAIAGSGSTDHLYLAGPGTTGPRTLAANGVATAIKITSNTWIISGTGLS